MVTSSESNDQTPVRIYIGMIKKEHVEELRLHLLMLGARGIDFAEPVRSFVPIETLRVTVLIAKCESNQMSHFYNGAVRMFKSIKHYVDL